MVGWCDGAGKLPVPGRPTIRITVGQGPTALAVGAGGGCLDILILIYPFFPLSHSLWETARYRLKYCLKGPLNPKQPTNQLSNFYAGRPKAALLFWFFGGFRCGVPLFIVMLVIYGKQLFTWLTLVVSLMASFFAVLFPTRSLG